MRRESTKLIFDQQNDTAFKYILKYGLLILQEPFLKVLFLKKKKLKKKKYYLSACTCFKNEAPYLKEWIDYNQLIGFDHFYLYNNNSSDHFREVLKPYMEKGVITLIDYPEIPCQPGVYEHWYNNFRHDTNWVTLIDVDEFYCPFKDVSLKDWLERNCRYPTLLVYWKMFGTNGILSKHDGLVTESYINCWDKLYAVGKQFYNTDYDLDSFTKIMHHLLFVRYMGIKIPPINIWGHFVRWNINRYSSKNVDIQLNHYWSKSYECYIEKHNRGSSAFGKSWRTFDKFTWHENHNISVDYKIYRFMIQLKLHMQNKRNG